jgi:hypothetical protein
MAEARKFVPIGEISEEDQLPRRTVPPPKDTVEDDRKLAENLLNMLFVTFSQRIVSVFSALFLLLALISSFWLWQSIMPNPTALQLIGLGMYAIFILSFEFVRRR